MKVILNKDISPLGEEGDVKDVAKGYARNYLYPRGLAVPYTDKTIKLFEARRAEIDARRADKRRDADSIKARLEGVELSITMPAGANGKLYGAVTNQTVVDELVKLGFQVERKRVELPGNHFKSVGKYKVHVKLYESAVAEVSVTVLAQVNKTVEKAAPTRGRHTHRQETSSHGETAAKTPVEESPVAVDAE